jgi:hypothetical protein
MATGAMPAQSAASRGEAALAAAGGGAEKTMAFSAGGDTPQYEKTVVGVPDAPSRYDPGAGAGADTPEYEKTSIMRKPEGGESSGG